MSRQAPGGSRSAQGENAGHNDQERPQDAHGGTLRVAWRPTISDPITITVDRRSTGGPDRRKVDDRRSGSHGITATSGFTARQREILKLVGAGWGNTEIAAALGISRRTVEKHVETIHMKAQTTSRARLVAFAASATSAANLGRRLT